MSRMKEISHAGHFFKGVVEFIEDMDPLASRKSPVLAFFAGVLFGFFGIGLYLWSWKDFGIGILLLLGAILMLSPFGFLDFAFCVPVGWLMVGTYGAYRVSTSNDNLPSKLRRD